MKCSLSDVVVKCEKGAWTSQVIYCMYAEQINMTLNEQENSKSAEKIARGNEGTIQCQE